YGHPWHQECIERFMLFHEYLDGIIQFLARQPPARDFRFDFMELAHVAHFSATLKAQLGFIDTNCSKRLSGLLFHLLVQTIDGGDIGLITARDVRTHVIFTGIHRKHPERTVQSRHGWNQHCRNSKLLGDEATVSWAATAARYEN